jgi:hypothetical protein
MSAALSVPSGKAPWTRAPPAVDVSRPRIDYESHAIGLDGNEVGALLVAAGLGRAADHALNLPDCAGSAPGGLCAKTCPWGSVVPIPDVG